MNSIDSDLRLEHIPGTIRRAATGLVLAGLVLTGSCSFDTDKANQTTTAVVESEHTAEGGIIDKLTRSAVEIRFTPNPDITISKGGVDPTMTEEDIEFNGSWQNCTATYIGNGWFITAAHCFEDSLHIGSGYFDQIYDAIGQPNGTFSVWEGWNSQSMDRIGNIDGLIINGNIGFNDFAMVHVSEGQETAELPEIGITEQRVVDIDPNDEYFMAGYPGTNGAKKINFQLNYLGLTSGQAFQDSYGLGDNYGPMPMFGVINESTTEPENACRPGMSGSVVINSKGEAMGVLSRFSIGGDKFWQSELGDKSSKYSTICIMQPINKHIVKEYQQMYGTQPPVRSMVVGGK